MTSMPTDGPSALDGAPFPTSVYRYYDTHGVLLYVGITKQGGGRNLQHNNKAAWWPHVVRQEVEHHPDRPSAEARERFLIRSYHPPFNRQHNIDSDELRSAYLAFAAAPADEMTPRAVYESLQSTGTASRRKAGRWLPLDVLFQTDAELVLRTQLEHSPLCAVLRLVGTDTPVVDVACAGEAAARIRHMERVANFMVFHCDTTKWMPPSVDSVKARIKWMGAGTMPARIQRVLIDSEKAGGRMM